jgi:hypothetical protein
MERPLAEAIQYALSETLPTLEAKIELARRALSDTVVPQMNAVVVGLQSGEPRIPDLRVDEGRNHAHILFGNRPSPELERLVPPSFRVSVAADGSLDITYDAGWFGDSEVSTSVSIASAEDFIKQNGLWVALFQFITTAEVAYRKIVLVGGS